MMFFLFFKKKEFKNTKNELKKNQKNFFFNFENVFVFYQKVKNAELKNIKKNE